MQLSKAQLARIERIRSDPDISAIAWRQRVVAETTRYLDGLARSVRECKRVDEASNFARWLQFSGVIELLQECPATSASAPALRSKAQNVVQACGQIYRGGKVKPQYDASDIAEINQKLNRLLRTLPTETVIDAEPVNALLKAPENF
jgi:hypothetical protein